MIFGTALGIVAAVPLSVVEILKLSLMVSAVIVPMLSLFTMLYIFVS